MKSLDLNQTEKIRQHLEVAAKILTKEEILQHKNTMWIQKAGTDLMRAIAKMRSDMIFSDGKLYQIVSKDSFEQLNKKRSPFAEEIRKRYGLYTLDILLPKNSTNLNEGEEVEIKPVW